jgi:hypothetical protein
LFGKDREIGGTIVGALGGGASATGIAVKVQPIE